LKATHITTLIDAGGRVYAWQRHHAGGNAPAVSVSARCGITAAGEALLRLYVYFLETPCTRILTFRFKDGELSLNCDEDPSLQNAATMLMELAGVTKTELFRRLMPLLKRERLQTHLRTFTTDTRAYKTKVAREWRSHTCELFSRNGSLLGMPRLCRKQPAARCHLRRACRRK
jgi:hypothetical protein